MTKNCQHMNFSAHVTVNRIEDKGRFAADVRIRCAECNLPFQFLGLAPGLDSHGARVSIDGQEARLAIAPLGAELSPIDRIAVNFGAGGRQDG